MTIKYIFIPSSHDKYFWVAGGKIAPHSYCDLSVIRFLQLTRYIRKFEQ